jgi:hypothetical protein
MTHFFEKQIDHFGDRVDQAIQLSGKELDARIAQVGSRLEEVILWASDELSVQRTLTREDIEYLIRYASMEFGAALGTHRYYSRCEEFVLPLDQSRLMGDPNGISDPFRSKSI